CVQTETAKTAKLERGIFEKQPGSAVFWIRYADINGRIRREKAGTRSVARKLYQLRKSQVLEGKRLPQNLRYRQIGFREIAADALEWGRTHKRSHGDDVERMNIALEWFGDTPACSLTPQHIQRKLLEAAKERTWKPATVNRYKALLSLTYRLALENGKV